MQPLKTEADKVEASGLTAKDYTSISAPANKELSAITEDLILSHKEITPPQNVLTFYSSFEGELIKDAATPSPSTDAAALALKFRPLSTDSSFSPSRLASCGATRKSRDSLLDCVRCSSRDNSSEISKSGIHLQRYTCHGMPTSQSMPELEDKGGNKEAPACMEKRTSTSFIESFAALFNKPVEKKRPPDTSKERFER